MEIEIVSTPSGQAPDWVREAWVGLRLPVWGDRSQTALTSGVVTGPKDPLKRIEAAITGQLKIDRGYAVEVEKAVDILAEHNAQAAQWWREQTPHLFEPGKRFLFRAECCRPIAEQNDTL